MSRRSSIAVLAALAAALLYLPCLGHGFVFDDRAVIAGNPLLDHPGRWPRLIVSPYWNTPDHPRTLYRPLTSATFALDRAAAGGLVPFRFHLTNILLHALATFLAARVALALLPGMAAPAIAALLFAAHPVQVEAVAGIVGRAEILAACGVFATLLSHRRALAARGAGWAIAAWAGYVVALGGKESGAVAPLLAALWEGAGPGAGEGRGARRRILYAGYLAILALYLGLRIAALGSPGLGAPIPFLDNPAAAAGPFAGRLTALGVVARNAALLLWPARLSADYSYDQIPVLRSTLAPLALAGLLIVVAAIGAGWRLRRRSPAAGLALLWLAVSAAPGSNLLTFIGTLRAERLLYLPAFGLGLLLAGAVAAAPRPALRRVLALLLAGAITAAAARTLVRLPEWRDDFALYESAARVSPRSARIRYNLGNAHLRRGAHAEAEAHYRAALAIYPDFIDATTNLGMALLQQGRAAEALERLRAAAARRPANADLAVNNGLALRAGGDAAGAEAEFRRALALDPGSARAHNNLGSMALARGDPGAAVAALREAVRLQPGEAVYRVNLGDALNALGRRLEAIAEFDGACRLDPGLGEVRRACGEAALLRGDRAAAERAFRAAASAAEPSARAANFLGWLLSERGEFRAAAGQYEAAVRIDPGLADAHRSLGMLLALRLGDPERGARHLERSLLLDPGQVDGGATRRLLESLRGRGGAGEGAGSER